MVASVRSVSSYPALGSSRSRTSWATFSPWLLMRHSRGSGWA